MRRRQRRSTSSQGRVLGPAQIDIRRPMGPRDDCYDDDDAALEEKKKKRGKKIK